MSNHLIELVAINRFKQIGIKLLFSVLTSMAIMLAAGASAHADDFTIVPNFGTSITTDLNATSIEGTINQAIQFYENTFSDPITVNITFNEMNTGLGSSSTLFANVSYASYLAALTADAKTQADATALSHLGPGPNNPVNDNSTINVKTANLRAVGIDVNPPLGSPDGFVGLNTHITDIGSPGTLGLYSLFATTEHEIDEVLGLGSALPGRPFSTIFPEDLFRYDQSGNRSFTTDNSALAYLSLDGNTDLAQFNNQNNGGDFGDWQSSPLPNGTSPKVQDAFATPGAHPILQIGSPEVTALDVIGYDATPVPEPATIALVSAGLALAALKQRKLRRTR